MTDPARLSTAYGDYRITPLDGIPDRLPYSIRILLENVLRCQDDDRVTRAQADALIDWGSDASLRTAIELTPSRAFLHDTNGVPALVDLATMRDAMAALGGDPARIGPSIPAELVVDHSVIADFFGTPDARERNVALEYERNAERYRFLKWGQHALDGFEVVPPGSGIMHQVNLERLARVVITEDGWAYPDVCLGTDSHTTMINGLGVLGWGIGGIDAEAVMLGETFGMLIPRVVGFRLAGALPAGATATDLVLTVTQLLRAHGVVGSFVEFFGDGVSRMSLADRATIANMSPESGATCIYFPIDDETIRYLRFTGRDPERVALVEAYAKRQGLWHRPDHTAAYTETIELDLGTVTASLAGPRRPQDRVALADARATHRATLPDLLPAGADPAERFTVQLPAAPTTLGHGAVAIAAITSCTNTSNPAVMLAAGLFARNAVAAGLATKPWVKTTLSPGSLVVTQYLEKAGLTAGLDALGFATAGYGCMTCIGASGPLIPAVQDAVREKGLAVAAVLSGNRNFDGRINPDVRMNYLASPPLVIAYALAGTMDIDLARDPLGADARGRPVRMSDLWPADDEIAALIARTLTPEMFAEAYRDVFAGDQRWRRLAAPAQPVFDWDPDSTYIRRPPFFEGMSATADDPADITGARVLALLGDSITTDHISPAGAIPAASVAGRYLAGLGVPAAALNTYASRRGNHEVMMRGCFANVRLRNRLLPGVEGGYTRNLLDGSQQTIFDAAQAYRAAGVPLVVIGGAEYGTGSSRDWAAKAPALLGVRAVLAASFERIHRANLIGMGILPLEFLPGQGAAELGITGAEPIDILGLSDPGAQRVQVRAGEIAFEAAVRLDTPRERELYRHGGVMKYVLRRQREQAGMTADPEARR
jgi:aconitate hydratase